MRPLIAAAALVLVSACDDEPPPATAASEPEVVELAELPAAYRTPQAMMQAMATGQLFERPERCDGFLVTDERSGLEASSWSAAARLARQRAGSRRAAVITRTVAADLPKGEVTVLSTPIGEGASPFRTQWRVEAGTRPGSEDSQRGDRLVCIRSVTFEDAL